MRLSILLLAALPLLVPATVGSEVAPTENRNILQIFATAQTLANMWTNDMFRNPDAKNAPQYISDALGYVLSFMGIFGGGNNALVKQLQQQYARIEQKLDMIKAGLDALKSLVKWADALSTFKDSETAIMTMSSRYNRFVMATSAAEKNAAQRALTERCKLYYNSDQPFILIQGITEERQISLSKSLPFAIRKYARDRRIQVMHFLLGVLRVAKLGAEIHVACAKLIFPGKPSVALHEQRILKSDLARAMRKILRVDYEVINGIPPEESKPVFMEFDDDNVRRRILTEWRSLLGQSNQNIASKVFTFLMVSYSHRRWAVLVHDHRSSKPNWYYNYRTQSLNDVNKIIVRERQGNKVIIVARCWHSNSMDRQAATNLLKRVGRDSRYSNAEEYVNALNGKVPHTVLYYVAKERSNVGAIGFTAQHRFEPGDSESGGNCMGNCPPFHGYMFG